MSGSIKQIETTGNVSLKELRHGDFQIFWSKLPQIITKYLYRTQTTYRTLRGRYQVNFR